MASSAISEMLSGTAITATGIAGNPTSVFYQDVRGGVREFSNKDGNWQGGTSFHARFQTEVNSPLAVVEWNGDGSARRFRIYSLNHASQVTEAAQNGTGEWFDGNLVISSGRVQAAAYSRLSALARIRDIKVYYQRADKDIQELTHTRVTGWYMHTTMPNPPNEKPLVGTDIASIHWGDDVFIRNYYQGHDSQLWQASGDSKTWALNKTGMFPKQRSPIAAIHWLAGDKRAIRIYFINSASCIEEWCNNEAGVGTWSKGSLTDKYIQVAPYSQLSAFIWDSKIRIYSQSDRGGFIQEWGYTLNSGNWLPLASLPATGADSMPVDVNGRSFAIAKQPFIDDLAQWRHYDPSTIDGVGILVGMHNGQLIGETLKTRQCVILRPNTLGNCYVYIYTPGGAIIYKFHEGDRRGEYTRHSQLGSGEPVQCAGEFRLNPAGFLDSMLVLVNDDSGHYQPTGSQCLGFVSAKFQRLGVDTSNTQWHWNR